MGEDSFLSEPVKFDDHCMDAMRYAIWGITSRFGFATARPLPTEPIKTLNFGNEGINDKVLSRWMRV